MADYKEINKLYSELFEKYGGMMSVSDLMKELSSSRTTAKQWANEHVEGILIGVRIKYETRLVAKAIVNSRGFC